MDHGACSFLGGVVKVVESVGNLEEWQESGERWCLKVGEKMVGGTVSSNVGREMVVLLVIYTIGPCG
nr:hypothetical protein [Tanacetum cinerariifolium]